MEILKRKEFTEGSSSAIILVHTLNIKHTTNNVEQKRPPNGESLEEAQWGFNENG